MIYNVYSVGGEIYHHGVKGMKWGVRRYQPYTSGYSAKNKGKYVNTDKKEDSGNVKNKGVSLSDRQKKMIKVGAIAAGTALAAYGAYKLYDSGAMSKFKEIGKAKRLSKIARKIDDFQPKNLDKKINKIDNIVKFDNKKEANARQSTSKLDNIKSYQEVMRMKNENKIRKEARDKALEKIAKEHPEIKEKIGAYKEGITNRSSGSTILNPNIVDIQPLKDRQSASKLDNIKSYQEVMRMKNENKIRKEARDKALEKIAKEHPELSEKLSELRKKS